jgi:hypothetical protein
MPAPEVNDVWASNSPADAVDTVNLPSGQIVHARRIGVESLVRAGILGESDELVQLVQSQHFRKGRPQDQAVASMMQDPKAFGSLMDVMDRSLPLIVVKPQVRLHLVDLPKPAPDGSKTKLIAPEDREPGVIYTDQIPFGDKVDLINYGVGGLASLTRFRQQPEGSVAAVADGQGVPSAPVRPAGNRQTRRKQGQSRSVRN